MRDRKTDAHRKAAERKLGRRLKPGEDVHHKDENKANNAEDNLEPLSHGAHAAVTNRSRATGLHKLRKALTMHERGEKLY